jgi:hypothetical protein
MKRLRSLGAMAVCLGLAAATAGAQGQFALRYVQAQEDDPVIGMNVVYAGAQSGQPPQIKVPPKGLSPRVRYFMVPLGPRAYVGAHVAAVLDQGASPPKLYVDAAGTGDLSAAAPLPAEGSDGSLTFVPVAVATGKEKGAGAVRIRFRSPGSAEYMGALPAGYMAGEVKLGGETYAFAVVDGDFDGRYTPLSSLSVAGASYWRADMMAIDLDRNGHFRRAPTDTEVMPLAKVLRAKDTYYHVQVAEDGSWVRLEDFEPKMGAIDVGASNLMLVLLSDMGLTTLTGSGGRWQLPEGTYRLASVSLSQVDLKGVKWMATNPDVDKIEPFRVRAGETLAMKIGPPLAPAATPDSAQSGLILINLFLVGQAGERYSVGLQKADGVRLPAPKVKILDGSGKVLAEGKAEYG